MGVTLYTSRTADGLTVFANIRRRVTVAAVSDGGTGYTVGDALQVVGGKGLPAELEVATAPGNIIATVTITFPGAYIEDPTNPVEVVGGTGSGAKFNLTLADAPVAHSDIVQINEVDGEWYMQYEEP
jgi:hypothetical protein